MSQSVVWRARAAEKAIKGALKRHRAVLDHRDYLKLLPQQGIQVCPVGALAISNLQTRVAVESLHSDFEEQFTDGGPNPVSDNGQRKQLLRWVARMVGYLDAGELAQLDNGFEAGAPVGIQPVGYNDYGSPFFKLGQRLAKQVAQRKARAEKRAAKKLASARAGIP